MSEAPIVRRERIRSMARDLFAEHLGTAPEEVTPHVTFLELGADSLSLMRASQMIRDRFGVKIAFRRLLDDLDTVDNLAAHLDAEMPEEPAPPPVAVASPSPVPEAAPAAGLPPHPRPADAPGSLKWILGEQLRLMSQQLELMRGVRTVKGNGKPAAVVDPSPSARRQVFVPFASLERGPDGGLTPQQRRHLDELTRRLTERTRGSKELTQTHRAVLANNRASAGFRQQWKELVYPLVAHRGSGARIWDVDGNEYVDLTMGFGSLLFGHSPPFLERALREQLDLGVQVGPESETAGRVAELVSELTGAERVTFCNSGTEAVMTALRLARTVHGRPKIAIFAGSFHGTFDGVLAKGVRRPTGELASVPMAPGVPRHMVEEVIMLDFDSFDCLDVVEAHAGELAAVLVEPRQSRRPDLEMKELLQRLREVTERHGIALVFDEVVTGFRLHPGGIQAIYDVRADITTYGKAVANGMPIGIVAGKAAYLDALDGGMWRYGDDSWPEADTTFFAGTFFRHPLVMAGALAVLTHLKEQGPALQEELGRRTTRFAATLNGIFEQQELPIRVRHYGSLFLFTHPPELRYMDLFFYHLLEKGIYVWERRVCYLSPAHTDEDLQAVVEAVRESVHELQASGFLPSSGAARTLPLTEAQKELWALAQLGDEASVAYNLSAALRLSGALEEEALDRALQTVADRHEALRVTIDPLGESQHVAPRLELAVRRSDFSAAQDREEELSRLRHQEARQPFDLARGPLVRAHLVKLEEELHVLLFTVHHIVVDAQGLGLVLGEVGRFYGAACRGETLSLPATQQLTDYVDYLERLEREGTMDQMEAYWSSRFSVPPPALELPYDRARPPMQTYVGQRHVMKLEPTLTAALRELARDQGYTLFMVLLTGVEILLHRLSGQDDLVVGIPTAGQPLVGGPLVGYCVNVLPVRTRISGRSRFADALQSVRGELLDAYEHQGYPVSRLVRKLGLRAEPSRPPLFSAMFNLDRGSGLEIPGLEVELLPNPTHAAQFDVEWNVTDTDSVLEVEFFYNTDLFDAATIERWQGYLRNLLAAAAADPRRAIHELELPDAAERDQLLGAWNRTEADFPLERTFPELFAEQVRRTPAATAAVFEGRELSYEELERRSGELARVLVHHGVELESVVALLAERNLEFLVAILAILKAGGVYLPLDPRQPVARHRQLLEDSAARCLLVSAEHLPAARASEPPRFLELATALEQEAPKSVQLPCASPDHLAYVIYTSGSTGTPKGAMVHHRGMLNHLWAKVSDLELDPEDAVAQTAPQFFDISVWQFLAPLLAGGRVAIYGNDLVYSPSQLIRRVEDDEVSVLELVPSLLRSLLETYAETGVERPSLEQLRWLLLTGEALPPELGRQWLGYYPAIPILNAYGPTECSDDVTHFVLREPPPAEAVRTPIGRPLANTRLYVQSRTFVPQPLAVPGELCVAGAGVGRGYLGRAARTAEVFVPDPAARLAGSRLYRTGDLVRWSAGGDLDFLHRLDHQVKIRGNRIELGEIEAALESHPAVREAVVVSHHDEGEAQLVAYLVAEGPAPESAELRDDLGQKVPQYMVPSFFVVLESMPLTANGKLDRRALPAPVARTAEIENSFTPPVTPTERILAELWSTVLGVDRVGVHDNFFELGGDSIAGIRIVARANQEGLRLSPTQIFQHRTIAELAAVAGHGPVARAEQESVDGPVPLTPIHHWFFEQQLRAPHHWNMSMLHRTSRPMSASVLAAAVRHLCRHHDVLRLRFSPGEEHAHLTSPDDGDPLVWVDVSLLDKAGQRAAVERTLAQLQGSLDLVEGPLLRVAFFDLGPGEPGRLFTLAHHLAVDIVSWQILTADLVSAYQQMENGGAVSLPAKTTSFQHWANRLVEHARSEPLQEELSVWAVDPDKAVPRLPVDHPQGANVEASLRHCSAVLGREDTRKLTRELPKVYRAQVSEILLAALFLAFRRWSGSNYLYIDLEGHGREQLFEDVDVTRTVGWFTALYPLLLHAEESAGPVAVLKAVKEQFRRIPNGGIGYGLLRYLSRDSESSERLRKLPQAELSFNYAGLEQEDGTSLLTPASESRGPSHSGANHRSHLLEIDGGIHQGELRMHWLYSENLHLESTIESFAKGFVEALRELIAASSSEKEASSVPSDFPRARVSQKSLDKLMSKLGNARS